MRRLLNPTVLILAAVLAAAFFYGVWRLDYAASMRIALALPFLFVWLIPLIYWVGERENRGFADHALHYLGYLSMGWLSFFLVFTIGRDLVLLIATTTAYGETAGAVTTHGGAAVLILSGTSMVLGALRAAAGPRLREVTIDIPDLAPGLEGFRIVQISDLHVGPTIKDRYVRRVVKLTNQLAPDLIALTGDIVDGSPKALARDVLALAELSPKDRVFFITGNHEYYAGAAAWEQHFVDLGHIVLANASRIISHKGATLLVAGVVDPAARIERRDLLPDAVAAFGPPAIARATDLRLLLAHNPKMARVAAKTGFDLQLSGHTHAGQFFPWTIVARLVHAPHFAGLSREGAMRVYVSAGTGTWGPPIRLGTRPELTLIKLTRAPA